MIFSPAWLKKYGALTYKSWNSFYQNIRPTWRMKSNEWTKRDIVKFLNDYVDYFKNRESQNDKVRRILSWVHGNLTYVGDMAQYGMTEYWASPEEIIINMKDDCDGGAALIYGKCIHEGVNPDRLYFIGGKVVGGGHAYVTFKRDKDGQEIPIDWCYYYAGNVELDEMLPYEENTLYFCGRQEYFRCNYLRGFGGRI